MIRPADALRAMKQEMVKHAKTGEASRLRGIIVTPELHSLLREEAGFDGQISVSGREGNRVIRYTFYVLLNPNFPERRVGNHWFFVPYPKEIYVARYLGREEEILASPKRRSAQVGTIILNEVNPIDGSVLLEWQHGGNWFYCVDYEELLHEAEKALSEGESVSGRLESLFGRYNLIQNPPEMQWVKDPSTYDYARIGDPASAIGRMFMRRLDPMPTRRDSVYQIVGIGINGYGQTVEVVMEKSELLDPWQFACFAVRCFLPEEIADFLQQYGVEMTPEWIAQVPVKEWWGVWYDSEAVGRLRLTHSIDGIHIIEAGFIGTRGKEHIIALIRTQDTILWEKEVAKHFPWGWTGWPATRQHRALVDVARSL